MDLIKYKLFPIITGLLLIPSFIHAQISKVNAEASNELKLALSDTTIHNVIKPGTLIIKDSATAVNVIEPILFSIYGKENIIKQRPYVVSFVNNYWIIRGTLHNEKGGTFLIIIDAENSKVIRITHGK